MRFPDWLKPKRQRREGNTVVVTLELDTSEVERRLRELGRALGSLGATAGPFRGMVKAAAEAEASMAKMHAAINADMAEGMRRMVRAELNRQEVRQAGLEARYYVRGGLDPTYATPEARDAYVKGILTVGFWDGMGHVRAAAFLRGWVEHHPEPVCECWWTDPSTWLSAASCGYGSGWEPGSQMEWNPDCPVHRPSSGVR